MNWKKKTSKEKVIKYNFSLSPLPIWTSPKKSQGKKYFFPVCLQVAQMALLTGASIGMIHPWEPKLAPPTPLLFGMTMLACNLVFLMHQ